MERHQERPFFVNVWLNDTHAILDPDEKQLEPYKHLMAVGLRGKHVSANAIYYAGGTDADRQIG